MGAKYTGDAINTSIGHDTAKAGGADAKDVQAKLKDAYSDGSITKAQFDKGTTALTDAMTRIDASNGASEYNADIANMMSVYSQDYTPPAAVSANGNLGNLSTGNGAANIKSMLGDGTTPFAKYLGEHNTKDVVYTKMPDGTDSTHIDAAATASNMQKDGLQMFQSTTGTTVLYDPTARSVGSFSNTGASVDNDAKLAPGDKNNFNQTHSFTFTAGDLKMNFGSGDGSGVDSKNKVYGASVAS